MPRTSTPHAAEDREGRQQVRAAVRALQIIETVAGSRRMKHSAIAKALDLPKSSTTLILETLVQEGFLQKDAESRDFSLGARLLAIAGRHLGELDIVRTSQPAMRRLVTELDESCFLVQAEGDQAVVLWRETCQHRLAYTLSLGERVGLAETAGGLSLLAFRPQAAWPAALQAAGLGGEALEATLRQLQAIREGAIAVCVNGAVRDVSSLAVPLVDPLGHCLGALSVAIPASRLDAAKQAAIEAALRSARRQVVG